MDPTLARALDEAVKWYGSEAASLRGKLSNMAFVEISDMAVEGLRRTYERRLGAIVHLFPDTSADEVQRHINAAFRRFKVEDRAPAFPSNTQVTLSEYLRITQSMLDGARDDTGIRDMDRRGGGDLAKGRQFARAIWAVMRQARIFDFEPTAWGIAYHGADVYTSEKILREKWRAWDGNDAVEPSKDDALKLMDTINEAATRVPFPEPLPFERCYIGFGPGVPLSSMQVGLRVADPKARGNIVAAAMLGYLVWQNDQGGSACEILQIVEAEDNYILPNVVCQNDQWIDPWQSLAPWCLTHLMGVIHEHRTLIVESPPSRRDRFDWNKAGKKQKTGGWLPKPYYLVHLRKDLIEEAGERNLKRLAKIARELRYRFDRRGHERCYIRRGALPIEEKDRQKLLDAGYRLWTIDDPDAPAYRQLMERGQPPKAKEEWLAILTRWIDETVVGAESLPYIPAIRVPSANTTERSA